MQVRGLKDQFWNNFALGRGKQATTPHDYRAPFAIRDEQPGTMHFIKRLSPSHPTHLAIQTESGRPQRVDPFEVD